MTKREVEEGSPGGLDGLCYIQGRGYGSSGDAGLFNGSGDQPHGLVANRSGRHQEEGVYPHRLELIEYLGNHLLLQLGAAKDTPHNGYRLWR